MAGSDLAALPDGALDDIASRVGTSLRGAHDGTGLRIGIGCALFNGGVTMRLLHGALEGLHDAGTDRRDITLDQALERSQPDHTNKGREAALTGVEMVRLLRSGPLS